jgi:hypothetical protein
MPTDELIDWGLGGSLWDDGSATFTPTGDETITATLRKRHTVNGVPTSYTSLVLADPAIPSTFGLRKVSDGTVIVANSTPYVETSTGVYEYTTPPLERGEQYEYWEYWSYGGETDRRQVFFTAPLAATHYGSRAGIEGWFGTGNLAAWADLNANGSAIEITAQIEKGLSYADNLIDLLATEAGLTPTLTSAALGTARYNLLVNLANELAGAWCYFNRGELDEPAKGIDGKMTEHLLHSEGSAEGNWRDGMIWKVLASASAALNIEEESGTMQSGTVAYRRTCPGDEFAGLL